MFLGAGSVMHGMHDQVDIRRFGGLWQVHEDHLDHVRRSAGSRSSACPPLSGFFSKEPIIAAAFERRGLDRPGCSAAPRCSAPALTAFYMTRLFVLTFHGPKRWTEDIKHPHESPPIMTVPLILLAVGSVGAGCLMATSVPDWLDPGLRPRARGGRARCTCPHR